MNIGKFTYVLPQFLWLIVVISSANAQRTLFRIEDDDPSTWLGNSVASVGDVNDDGIPDFAVSGTEDEFGIVRVFISSYSIKLSTPH